MIGRLVQAKDIVISYNLWICCKVEEFFSLILQKCTGTDIKNHIGMPSTTDTDGVYLYKYFAEVVENFYLEANIVGITIDGGGNLRI